MVSTGYLSLDVKKCTCHTFYSWDYELTTSSVNSLSEILDPDATTVVYLPQLQKLCSRGQNLNYMCTACTHSKQGFPMNQVGFVPESGSEFRIIMLAPCPLFMKKFRLFFGTLPNAKTSWKSEVMTRREAYYVSLTAITDIRVENMSVSRIWYDNYLVHFLNLQILVFWTTHCAPRTDNYTGCLETFMPCSKMNQNRSVNAR